MAALDIPEAQVAIDFPQDANFTWHVRVLVARLTDSVWIGFSPDLEAELVDLRDHRVVPLVRNAPFPARVRGDIYSRNNITEVQLLAARQECQALASVMGPAAAGAAAPPAASEWLFADTAYEKFGDVVDPNITRNPVRMLTRESIAMVQVEDDGVPPELFWSFAERVGNADVETWKDEKRAGPGRDARILPITRDAAGGRYRSLRECLGDMSFPEPAGSGTTSASSSTTRGSGYHKPQADWPYDGPSGLKEVLTAARAAGEELPGFHDYYCRAAGLSMDHPTAIKHRDLLLILHHLIVFDQLNAGRLASAEALARLLLQIHQAVRRNPKAPDFKGTNLMTMSKLDSSGGVLTGDFAKYVADEQKTLAFTLKQQRLFAEEEDKRKGKPEGKGEKK